MPNQASLAVARADLLAHQVRVQAELARLQEAMWREVDSSPDEGDSQIIEWAKNAALHGVLERRLQEIHAALRAIDNGVYGICERCGAAIEAERLQVKADATLCLACQRAVEARGQPLGSRR